MGRWIRGLSAATIAIVVLGCASSAPAGPPSSEPATPVATAAPVATATPAATDTPLAGIIAIGHSGLTGEGTGGPGEAMPANSWATGTNPAVDSVYLRMTAIHPETTDNVADTAHGGATADQLPTMAGEALKSVPHPALAIISTIDNDIRCDGTDALYMADFGASVKNALVVIRSASPDTKILIVGQAGRPSIPFVEELVAHEPSLKAAMSGSGMCDLLDASGKPVPAHFEALTKIIESYEAEEARVCAAAPNCRTDGGARAAYVDKLENFAQDWAHLNVRGQAAEAELIWPVVKETLGW